MPDTMTVNGAEYTVRRLLGTRYYIDYECNAYMEQWDFEHGLRRHRKGRRKHENPLGGQTLYAIPALLVLAAYCDV